MYQKKLELKNRKDSNVRNLNIIPYQLIKTIKIRIIIYFSLTTLTLKISNNESQTKSKMDSDTSSLNNLIGIILVS